MPPIHTLSELRERARELGPRRVAVAAADDAVALTAAHDAMRLGMAEPVLLGDVGKMRDLANALGLADLMHRAVLVPCAAPAQASVAMAREGEVDIVLKGHLRTDELLRAALDKTAGLRTGRLLSDILLYEDRLSGSPRLVGITDGGLNVAPDRAQKTEIIRNAVEVLHRLGFTRPRIALMSATEAVSDEVPSSADAGALTAMGRDGAFGVADVFGPLAFDNALLPWAAEAKGIRNPVAGRADCLVVPSIEAGNLLGKAVKYLTGSQCAHVVVGATVPILIPSRVESADDKVNAIALGVIHAAG